MPKRDLFDRGSKWLIQHHGDSLLRLGGAGKIRSWRPLAPEVVHPRQWPDGLLEVVFENETDPDLCLVEISTYPERRVYKQMLRDAALVWLDRQVLPEVLTLVLRPKGKIRIVGRHHVRSRRGWAKLGLSWRVVEMWEVPAEELFAANDVGLIPWVPLARFDGPAESVLRECRDRIDRQAPEGERANLLAVTQVMAKLRYNQTQIFAILGGRKVMIESPLIQELVAERLHKFILNALNRHFGDVPSDLQKKVESIQKEERLEKLLECAYKCTDLNAFVEELEQRRVKKSRRRARES